MLHKNSWGKVFMNEWMRELKERKYVCNMCRIDVESPTLFNVNKTVSTGCCL